MGSPLFGLAIIIFVSIAFLILGQLYKGKFNLVRYTFWAVSCVLLISIIINPFVKNRMEIDGEKQIVGVYHIDVNNSKFDSLKLHTYADLILTVKDNNTFIINRAVPFFKSLTGKWNLTDDGDISFIKCSFDNNDLVFEIQNNNLFTFNS